ncbi:MAG: lipoprotein-releasing system ATP-binding protein LolD [Flavobacteriaceae bacterium]|nr:lipoprotein-releasing system ATP-binding protein LolD [Flavobacteriaceae bacterium]|tara:strand:+ start:8160 stop:8822 length:663 start_codon:yes stop_codon:yes gene_type:complete
MIKANSIFKSYKKVKVLKGIDLEINKGEIVCITGPSGAGKTTLLEILGTLSNPDPNTKTLLELDGKNLISLNSNQIAKFRNETLGFVFQFHELLPEFNALENVCLPAWIGKKNLTKSKKRAEQLLNQLGLSKRLYHPPSELSGGEQQRVAVARALMNKPKIIFADEPSGNLDIDNANELHDLFFELRDNTDCTFVIVTHNEMLANKSDRKIYIKDGHIEG